MLYLVGENLNNASAHYRAKTGQIVQLMRGIYADADEDVEGVALRHSVRIAKYLYPRAYLSGASAILLSPTKDGRLFISGPRSNRTRIRTLEIIQNVAPAFPYLSHAFALDSTIVVVEMAPGHDRSCYGSAKCDVPRFGTQWACGLRADVARDHQSGSGRSFPNEWLSRDNAGGLTRLELDLACHVLNDQLATEDMNQTCLVQ